MKRVLTWAMGKIISRGLEGPDSTAEHLTPDQGGEVLVHRVDGVAYPCSPYVEKNFNKQLEHVRNLALRSDDVLAFGIPRSGNHWMFEIINMVAHGEPIYNNALLYSRMPSLASKDRLASFAKENSPRQFASHLKVDIFSEQILQARPFIVYIVRNPKDIFVSQYHLASTIRYCLVYKGSWEQFFKLALNGDYLYGSWFDHVLSFDQFVRDHPEIPVHIVSFESLKANLTEEIERLATYMGKDLDPEVVAKIAEHVQFQKMKKKQNIHKKGFQKLIFRNKSAGFLRKGNTGEWRDMFTREQSDEFDRIFEERMGDSPIAKLVRPYLKWDKSEIVNDPEIDH